MDLYSKDWMEINDFIVWGWIGLDMFLYVYMLRNLIFFKYNKNDEIILSNKMI